MSRRRTMHERLRPDQPEIRPTAVYSRQEAHTLLRITRQRLAEEFHAGRIRCKWEGNRQLFLGQWLLDWLASEPAEHESATT